MVDEEQRDSDSSSHEDPVTPRKPRPQRPPAPLPPPLVRSRVHGGTSSVRPRPRASLPSKSLAPETLSSRRSGFVDTEPGGSDLLFGIAQPNSPLVSPRSESPASSDGLSKKEPSDNWEEFIAEMLKPHTTSAASSHSSALSTSISSSNPFLTENGERDIRTSQSNPDFTSSVVSID